MAAFISSSVSKEGGGIIWPFLSREGLTVVASAQNSPAGPEQEKSGIALDLSIMKPASVNRENKYSSQIRESNPVVWNCSTKFPSASSCHRIIGSMISFAGENPSRLVKLRNDWWSGCLVFLSGEKKSIGFLSLSSCFRCCSRIGIISSIFARRAALARILDLKNSVPSIQRYRSFSSRPKIIPAKSWSCLSLTIVATMRESDASNQRISSPIATAWGLLQYAARALNRWFEIGRTAPPVGATDQEIIVNGDQT